MGSGNMNKDRMIDRIGDYLIPHTNDYIFDELSESCLERAGILFERRT